MNTVFIVYTDNNLLTYILTSAQLDATGQRWGSELGHFNCNIIYRSGYKDAGAMSRYPFEKLNEDNVYRLRKYV